MKNIFIGIIILFSAGSFSLKESEISTVYKLLEDKTFYKFDEFLGTDNVKIKYAKIGNKKGSKGSLVFVNGLNENIINNTELYYDFYKAGYSPIYVMDHRGQGLSGRLGRDSKVVHINSFKNYKKDFEFFISKIVLKDSQMNKNNLYALANSMGGAITIDYLQSVSKQSPFKAIAFTAPLIKIKTPVPYFLFEFVFIPLYKAACSLKYCDLEVWNPFKSSPSPITPSSTKSAERQKFINYVSQKYKVSAKIRPSYGWVIEASRMHKHFFKKERLEKIKTKMLIVQAKNETLVSNKAQEKFCSSFSKDQCLLKVINGRHAILSEKDFVRDEAISEIIQFFNSYSL